VLVGRLSGLVFDIDKWLSVMQSIAVFLCDLGTVCWHKGPVEVVSMLLGGLYVQGHIAHLV